METLEDRIISEEEETSLYQGLFILETVIPTKEPRFKKYRLSRDELEDFFEGYEEFAEYVVSVERDNDA